MHADKHASDGPPGVSIEVRLDQAEASAMIARAFLPAATIRVFHMRA